MSVYHTDAYICTHDTLVAVAFVWMQMHAMWHLYAYGETRRRKKQQHQQQRQRQRNKQRKQNEHELCLCFVEMLQYSTTWWHSTHVQYIFIHPVPTHAHTHIHTHMYACRDRIPSLGVIFTNECRLYCCATWQTDSMNFIIECISHNSQSATSQQKKISCYDADTVQTYTKRGHIHACVYFYMSPWLVMQNDITSNDQK